MKGCARSALLSLLALAAIVGGIAAGLNRWYGARLTDTIGIALFGGLLGWIASNLLISAVKAWRERGALLGGIAGTAPEDGRQVILVGHVGPIGTTLTAPLSGTACLAYTFEIYEMVGQGKRRSKVTHCEGVGLVPSIIVTAAGSFRLLAVPELDLDETTLDRETAVKNAAELIRTTPVEPLRAFSRPPIEKQWSDEDGEYRQHSRRTEREVNWNECRMIERHLKAGARVSIFGQYSSAKRAIVTDPQDWSKITRIMKGDPEAVAAQLRASTIRRTIGFVLALAAMAGTIAAFVSSLA